MWGEGLKKLDLRETTDSLVQLIDKILDKVWSDKYIYEYRAIIKISQRIKKKKKVFII